MVNKLKIIEESLANTIAPEILSVSGVGSLVQTSFPKMFTNKEYVKGILISAEEETVIFDIYINVIFGSKIPQTAFAVQEAVKKIAESKYKISKIKVNIHVQGIDF